MRDASFHLLDRAAWPRSEHFDYYIRTVKCRYDLTAHLAVTALRERGKALGLRFYPLDRKSTRLNSSHSGESRMPSSA